MCRFHVSNLFPANKQAAASFIVSGFVLSGAVFPIWQLLAEALGPGFGRPSQSRWQPLCCSWCVCVCVNVCVCEYVCVHACVSHPGGPRAWTAPAGAMPRMIARRVLRCRSARCLLGPRGAGRRAVPALRSDLLVRPADGGAVIALEAAPIAT